MFLSGPRQVGKTTLARRILGDAARERYFNWDYDEDRERILRRDWPAGAGLLVFDEIHKHRPWRNLIKGLFDKRREEVQILVTDSARLDLYRRGGDSLQGRYHFHQLHPFSAAELGLRTASELEDLLQLGGFPEPFLAGNLTEKKRWTLEYGSRLLREDLRDLERVTELGTLERLALRLPELVGSPLSYNALREDLRVAHATVVRWCEILERLYFLFRIYPFGAPRLGPCRNPPSTTTGTGRCRPSPGHGLENLVASHLLKWCHFERDTAGRELELRYFRDIDGREVDFVVLEDRKPIQFVECKSSDRSPSRALLYLKLRFPRVEAWQLTTKPGLDRVSDEGIRTISLGAYLARLVSSGPGLWLAVIPTGITRSTDGLRLG